MPSPGEEAAPREGRLLSSLEGLMVPREQQHRLAAVAPVEAITILTQCSRAYVEKAATALGDRQQQHVDYVDARLSSLAAEFVARSETMSRVLAHTHEAQAAVQVQLDGVCLRLASDVQAFVDEKLRQHGLAVSEDLLKRAATYASEAQAARDASQAALTLAKHQLANAVRNDAHAYIDTALAKVQQCVVANLLEVQNQMDSKIAALERRLDAAISDRFTLAADEGRNNISHLGARLGQLRDDFDGEIGNLRAAVEKQATVSEERAILRAQELIQDRVQAAIIDARGLFESKIRATESHLRQFVQDAASRSASNTSVEQHLHVLREHIDVRIRDATNAMHEYLNTSQVRAASRITELLKSQPTDQLTDERVLELVCERVGAELQEVDERVDKKLDKAHEQMIAAAKQLFAELVQQKRAPGSRPALVRRGKHQFFIGGRGVLSGSYDDEETKLADPGPINNDSIFHQTETFGASRRGFGSTATAKDRAPDDDLWHELMKLVSDQPETPVSRVDSTKPGTCQVLRLQDLQDEPRHTQKHVQPESRPTWSPKQPHNREASNAHYVSSRSGTSRVLEEASRQAQAEVAARADVRARELQSRLPQAKMGTKAQPSAKATTTGTAIWDRVRAAKEVAQAAVQARAEMRAHDLTRNDKYAPFDFKAWQAARRANNELVQKPPKREAQRKDTCTTRHRVPRRAPRMQRPPLAQVIRQEQDLVNARAIARARELVDKRK